MTGSGRSGGDPGAEPAAREGVNVALPADALPLDPPAGAALPFAGPAAHPYADAAALDRLLARLLPVVLGWCHRFGGPAVDAEEAAHDVLMTVVRRIGDLRPGAPVEPWAFGITRRIVRSHRRRAWVRRWVPDALVDVAGGRTPERTASMNETAAKVQAVLEVLPDMHREVIVLCDVEERSRSEVAEILGIPEGTVKSRLRLAREQFRRRSAELGMKFGVDDVEVDDE